MLVDVLPGAAPLREQRGDGSHRVTLRVRVGQLLPGERCGDRGAGQRARRVGRGDGAITIGLVEVDEHPLAAFLLPPRRGDQLGEPALEFPCDADHGVAHVLELVGGMDAGVDVHPAVAGCLRVRGEAELAHEGAQSRRRGDGVVEIAPGLRIEVDAQLVRIVDVGRAHRPGVEGDGAHLRRPRQGGRLVEDQLIVASSRRVGAHHGAQVRRYAPRGALGEELLPLDAVGETLQRHGPVAGQAKKGLSHGEKVVGQLSFRDGFLVARTRPYLLVRAAQLDLAWLRPGHLQHDLGHRARYRGAQVGSAVRAGYPGLHLGGDRCAGAFRGPGDQGKQDAGDGQRTHHTEGEGVVAGLAHQSRCQQRADDSA